VKTHSPAVAVAAVAAGDDGGVAVRAGTRAGPRGASIAATVRRAWGPALVSMSGSRVNVVVVGTGRSDCGRARGTASEEAVEAGEELVGDVVAAVAVAAWKATVTEPR